jgi:hypothetical protein
VATIGALVRAAGDNRGTMLGLQEDFHAWSLKWDLAMEQRARINEEYIKVFIKITKFLPGVMDKVMDMWQWMQEEGYAGEVPNLEDHREGMETGVEKKREEWRQVVAEDMGDAKDMEDIEEDRDSSEVDEIEEEEVVEMQGKGKGKEKVTEKGVEENTLT